MAETSSIMLYCRLVFTIALFLIYNLGNTQKPTYVWKEVITGEEVFVASTFTNYTSNKRDRVLRKVTLPTGTVGYVFKITVNGGNSSAKSLFSLLEQFQPTRTVGLLGSLITNGDGSDCDVFVFSDEEQADMFVDKQQGWRACQLYKQTSATCRYAEDCLDMVSFGFRNNNNGEDLKVRFELVALVDSTAKPQLAASKTNEIYARCISNDSLGAFLKDKKDAYCACWTEKMKGDSILLTNRDLAHVIEQRSLELAKQCFVEVGVITRQDLDNEILLEEYAKVQNDGDSRTIIEFCTNQIKLGHELEELYNGLGWQYLITKQFTKAKYYLETAANKFPLSLYIQGNWAHALLLTGDFERALNIYKAHLQENIDEQLSWRDALLSDIKTFKKEGIENEHFEELIALAKKGK